MRVLVCGGRNFRPGPEDFSAISSFLLPGTTLIHGDAPGADRFARDFARDLGFIEIVAFPADWKKHGKAAGPIRNQQMIDEGKPDMVLVFPGGAGTLDMVKRAKAAGIPICASWAPDGGQPKSRDSRTPIERAIDEACGVTAGRP